MFVNRVYILKIVIVNKYIHNFCSLFVVLLMSCYLLALSYRSVRLSRNSSSTTDRIFIYLVLFTYIVTLLTSSSTG